MFLNKKTKKVVRIFWSILGVLIILSMILLYAPGLFTPAQHTQPAIQSVDVNSVTTDTQEAN